MFRVKKLKEITEMKLLKYITVVFCAVAGAFMSGCDDEYTDYYTSAQVTVVAPDTVQILQIQGVCAVTCLSNDMSYQSSTWNDKTVTFSNVLRGPYSILVSGTAAITTRAGRREIHNFRASSSYVEFMDHPSSVELQMLLLQ